MLLFFKLIDYLLGALAITSVFVIYVDSDNQQYVTAASVALTVAIGLFLLNRQSVKNAKNAPKNC